MSRQDRVCVGQFAAAHGVRGLVKLRSFTEDPAAIGGYGPFADESGRRTFKLRLLSAAGELWVAQVEGVATREAAEALKGVRLYVDRDRLPEPEDEDEFYYADLIGLRAETVSGEDLGTVRAVHDFGAGVMLEVVLPTGRGVMVPFTREAVPVVDVKGGRVGIDPPLGLLEDPAPEGEGEGREEGPEEGRGEGA